MTRYATFRAGTAALALLAVALPPGKASATLVHSGDSTIQGGLCVGFDCAGNEPMGFATIKIEENNLRIGAADSSSVSGFPTTDWQIEFNSSSSGGGNYFMIRDCGSSGVAGSVDSTCGGTPMLTIEGGADNESIHVDSSGNQGGNVGFGTATPVVDLHALSGNTPTLRLEQDNSSGFTPQSWDLAGNESNFFIRDVTNGSALPFRIEPGTASNTLYLDNNERVGIGTTAPAEELHIRGAASETIAIELENDSSWRIRNQGTAGATDGWLEFRNANAATTIPMRIAANANNNLLLVGAANASTADADRVSITGELFINGVDNSNPDYVFDPDYELVSIEEQAAYMWTHKHLPAVGPGVNGENGKAVINVANRSQGILEELEKAHIYIEQLHAQLQALQNQQLHARLQALEEQLATR